MKRILKKLLVILLIFLTINTFIFQSRCYADGPLEIWGKSFIGVLVAPIQLVVVTAGKAINLLTSGIAYMDGAADGVDTTKITPFEILFNKVKLVDVNIFDLSDEDSIVGQIRGGIATWYYVLRMIATAILLIILIYVGIRMALSTVASDKAMYKKMIIDWVCSLALIYLLQYIMIFTLNVNSAIVGAMESIAEQTDGISDVLGTLSTAGVRFGANGIASAAVYFILVTQTIGLLISYITRMLKISFLVIISPLITLTYSIDKMGDGKAQALGTWLKEFVFSTLIQPFHCVIYMIMVSTALNLLVEKTGELGYAVLAILCIKFIQDAEKIVRKIFHFEDDNSGTSVAAGMATSALLLSQSKNIGRQLKAGATGLKNLKTNAGEMATHVQTDFMVAKAIMSGNNTRKVEVKNEDGTVTEQEEKMSIADLKEEALTKQAEKQADKLAKKVLKTKDGAQKQYSADTKKENLNKEDRARYEVLRGSGMSHARAMASLRKEKVEQIRKERKEAKHPTITKAKTMVKAVSQMDTFKDLQAIASTYAAVGVGTATAVGLWGNGSNAVTSISSGAAAYGATKEFMKNTNKTLVNTATQSVMALGAKTKEEAIKDMREIANMDPTAFDKDSPELKSLLDNIKAQLLALGMNEKTATRYSNNIQNQISSNAKNGNPKSIDSILQENIDSYNESPESARSGKIDLKDPEKMDSITSLQESSMGYSDFENKRIVYETIQNAAQASGMTVETCIAETAKEVERQQGGFNSVHESFYKGRTRSDTSNPNPDPQPEPEPLTPDEQRERDETVKQVLTETKRDAFHEIDDNEVNLAEKMGDEVAEQVTEDMEKKAKQIIEDKIKEIEAAYKIENEEERAEALYKLETQMIKEFNDAKDEKKIALSSVKKHRGSSEEQEIAYSLAYVEAEFQRAALQQSREYLTDRKKKN